MEVKGWKIERFSGKTVYLTSPEGDTHSVDPDGDLCMDPKNSEQGRGYDSGSPESRYIPIDVVEAAIKLFRTPEEETCAYCGESFPAPVSLHHSEDECLENRKEAKAERETNRE